jgi:hypothetical protein
MAAASPTYCAACGSAQASHTSLWLDNLTDALSHRVPMHKMPFYRTLLRITNAILTILGQLSFFAGRALRLVSLSSDVETTVSNRSKLVWQEALRRGLDIKQVMLLRKPTDMFRIRHNGRTEFFTSLPLSPDLTALAMDDKVLFKEAMAAAGLPVPKSFGVSSLSAARKAHAQTGISCVKPRTGSNGRHTYPNIRTDQELVDAYTGAREIGPFITVEEFIEGDLCRATCVGGKMIGFLQSAYPTVMGDGVSTIAELIQNANAIRLDGVDDMELDAVNDAFIQRRGYTRDSVLPRGTSLALTYRGGTGSGGSNRELGRDIHPSFIPIIEKAAGVTGLHIVGFDIIIPDPQKPESEQTWGFIESNSLPWTDLHTTPYYGEPIDLSPAIWDLWLERAT